MNACEKYYWILEHPEFINPKRVLVELDVTPHMVCPVTNRIEDFAPLNTKHQLWVELMVPELFNGTWEHAHDWRCDTGGSTWEEMIDKLYELVVKHYGTYTEEERSEKVRQCFGNRISKQTIISGSRKLKVRWDLREPAWKNDILTDSQTETLTEEIPEVQGTIKALTEYRKTCNISEYDAVDYELEKNKFILFEQQLSLTTGIDLVRK